MTPTATTNSSQLTRQEINQKQKEFIFPSVTTYYSDPVPMDHALMQHVWAVDGKKNLDFFRGVENLRVGHFNPPEHPRPLDEVDPVHPMSLAFSHSAPASP